MTLQSEDIVGYRVCVQSVDDVVSRVTSWLKDEPRKCRYFACLNPHSVEVAAADVTFHNSLVSADFLTPDGIGVVYASRLLGGKIRERVTGMDVFLGLSAAMERAEQGSFFFLGSTEETLHKIREEMAVRFPHVVVAGCYSPPFKPEFSAEDNQRMIAAINEAKADVLWVGLTAPKQEKWIFEHREQLNVGFAAPVGAVFDMFVGNINRVGPFWQNLGFEWLPRLVQEPKRLWRRSLVSAPRFLLRALSYRLRK